MPYAGRDRPRGRAASRGIPASLLSKPACRDGRRFTSACLCWPGAPRGWSWPPAGDAPSSGGWFFRCNVRFCGSACFDARGLRGARLGSAGLGERGLRDADGGRDHASTDGVPDNGSAEPECHHPGADCYSDSEHHAGSHTDDAHPTPTVVCPAEELTFALVEEWQGGEFALTPDPTQTMLTGATVTGTIEGTHELELWVWVALDDTNGRTTYQRFTETYPVVWGATAFNGFALDPATGDLSVNLDELWDAENAAAVPATEALLAEHFDAFVADVEAQATALTAPGGEFV